MIGSRSFGLAASSEFWMPSRMSASLRFSKLSAVKNASLAESGIRSQGCRALKCHWGFIVVAVSCLLGLRLYLGAEFLAGLCDEVGDAQPFPYSGEAAQVHHARD